MPQIIKEGCRLGTKNTLNAQDRLISCEKCDRFAVTPFKRLLEESAQGDSSIEVAASGPVKCPGCSNIVDEDTLVVFRSNLDSIETHAGDDYFDPPLEEMTVRLVDENLRAAAQSM